MTIICTRRIESSTEATLRCCFESRQWAGCCLTEWCTWCYRRQRHYCSQLKLRDPPPPSFSQTLFPSIPSNPGEQRETIEKAIYCAPFPPIAPHLYQRTDLPLSSPQRESGSVTGDDWLVSCEMKANVWTFSIVWMDPCAFKTGFHCKKGVWYTPQKAPVYKKSGIFQFLCVAHFYVVHVSYTCLFFGCLLFWLSFLASLGKARREERRREMRVKETERGREYLLCWLVLVTVALWVCAHSLRLLETISWILLLFKSF